MAMQLFIGGTCSGKRRIVRQRFGASIWHSAYAGKTLGEWRDHSSDARCLVLEGWECWIETELESEPDDDRLRARLCDELDALHAWGREQGVTIVLIMLEMGRGIVPLSPEARRLRDLNGWLAQGAAARCAKVWYVWNGLVRQLAP